MKRALNLCLAAALTVILASCSPGNNIHTSSTPTATASAISKPLNSPDSKSFSTDKSLALPDAKNPFDSKIDQEATRQKLLSAIDTMTSYSINQQLKSNENGAKDWQTKPLFTQKIDAYFDHDTLNSWLTNGNPPNKASGGVVTKKMLRYLVQKMQLTDPRNDATKYLHGSIPPGTPALLDFVTCAQDGTFFFDQADLLFDPQTGNFRSVTYIIHTPDFTVGGNTPETKKYLKCGANWEFSEVKGGK